MLSLSRFWLLRLQLATSSCLGVEAKEEVEGVARLLAEGLVEYHLGQDVRHVLQALQVNVFDQVRLLPDFQSMFVCFGVRVISCWLLNSGFDVWVATFINFFYLIMVVHLLLFLFVVVAAEA